MSPFFDSQCILQASVVTQTALGELIIYPRVANFIQCICAKNYENWLAVGKVIARISRLSFLAHPVIRSLSPWAVRLAGRGALFHLCLVKRWSICGPD